MMEQPLLQIDQLLLPDPAMIPAGAAPAGPISLDVAVGQFHLLAAEDAAPLGRLMRVIAGYEAPRQGRLLMRSQPLGPIALGARGIASITGDPRLFPQLTIGRNILFPLTGERRIGDTATAVAGAALRVGLSAAVLDRYPDEVGLATQLRTALARALALGPSLLLLTDPLRDLPAGDAGSLLQDIRRLQRDLSLTIICATDRLPVWAPIADRITLLETAGGRLRQVVQTGSAEDIYLRPENQAAARLSGTINLLPVDILGRTDDDVTCHSPLIDPATFTLPHKQVAANLLTSLPAKSPQSPKHEDSPALDSETAEIAEIADMQELLEPAAPAVVAQAHLLLRPNVLRPGLGIRRQDFRIEGRIQDRFSDGAIVMIQVMIPDRPGPIIATMPAPAPFPLEQGMAVSLGWNRGDMRLLPVPSMTPPRKPSGI